MLSWALTFLVIALLAGLFGFGLVGGMAYTAAKILFFMFLASLSRYEAEQNRTMR